MNTSSPISRKVAALLVYGRPPLVFAGLLCALGVMWTQHPFLYILGVFFLFTAMTLDLIDGWYAARHHPNIKLAHLADRIMDKIVFSIIFPLVSVGMIWRLHFISEDPRRVELLHAILVLLLCITVMIRDHFAHFIRGFALKMGVEPEEKEFSRLRTIVAAPVGALLYTYAFYIPNATYPGWYHWITWIEKLTVRDLFFIEIIFLIINFGSIASYCRKYGSYCLDEICFDNIALRRKILAVFPNSLTVMNAAMGLMAVFFAYQDRIREAFLFIMGATLFDKLDGAVARRLGLTDNAPAGAITMGGIMDDISDGVSFCIVPAWIFYIVLDNATGSMVQQLPIFAVACLYALLGITRLIYFTLDRKPIPGFFKGLPTPAAALLVTAPLVVYAQALADGSAWTQEWALASFSILLVACVLMNAYPIRYLHFGRFMGRRPWFVRITLTALLCTLFTPYFGHVSLLYVILYLLSPIVTWKIDPEVAARETRTV